MGFAHYFTNSCVVAAVWMLTPRRGYPSAARFAALEHTVDFVGHLLSLLSLLGLPLGSFVGALVPDVPATMSGLPFGAVVAPGAAAVAMIAWRRTDATTRPLVVSYLVLAAYALMFAISIAGGRLSVPGSSPIIDVYLSMCLTTLTLFTVARLHRLCLSATVSARSWWAAVVYVAVAVSLAGSYAVYGGRLLDERRAAGG